MHYPDLFIGGDRGEGSRSGKKRLGYKEGEGEGDATQTPGTRRREEKGPGKKKESGR